MFVTVNGFYVYLHRNGTYLKLIPKVKGNIGN